MEALEGPKSLCLDLFLLKIHKETGEHTLVDLGKVEESRFLRGESGLDPGVEGLSVFLNGDL